MTLREARAGIRRWPETDIGEQYSRVVAHVGEGVYEPPGVAGRTLGDMVDPTRPGRVTDLVNAVSRELGSDAKGWRYDRLVSMGAQLEREAQERDAAPDAFE